MARTETLTQNGSSKIQSKVDERVTRIRDDIAQLAGTVTEAGADAARGLKDAAAAKTSEVASISAETLADLRNQLAAVEARIEGKVRERPLTALAIAAAAGFVIAMMARR